MKKAIGAVLVLSSIGACSTPASNDKVATGSGGTGGTTGGAGGSAGTVASMAGTTGMSVGGSSGGVGGTVGGTGGTVGGSAGTVSTGGASGGSAGTTGGAGGVGGAMGGSAGTAVATGGMGGDAMSVGGMGGVAMGGSAGAITSGAGGTAAGAGGSGGAAVCAPPTVNLTGADAVAGTLITFNTNGGWCWYQDERAVVDTTKGKLIVGSVASPSGNIEAVIYDIAAGTKTSPAKLGTLSIDDHNAAALNIRPDGKYVATWATHRSDCNTYYSIYDGSSWAAQKTFDWSSQGCPWDGDNTHKITYNNLWYLDGKLIDVARSVGTSPNLIASSDDGATWAYYGRLTYTPLTGYVAGYYKYWGNNTDRVDFLGTEAHPRDNDNSLWHGYMSGGKIYKSDGTVVDSALAGTSATSSAVNIDQYTSVFKTGTSVNGVKLCRMWNHDIVRYADGTIAMTGQGRADNCSSTPGGSDPDKRMIYARYDGTSWKTTYLVKAGPKLYADEEDYTGLSALVPDDPTTIYVSTPYNPTTDTMGSGGKREIWRGTTCDNGATFKWTAVTANSTKDNIRPIVPKWDATHTALLWMKGSYTSAQNYSEAIVGIVSAP